jgi:outer membrane lipoprotein-sorting protein
MGSHSLGRRAALGLLAASMAWPAGAQLGRRWTEADQADIARIEAYLNELKTLSARFIQINDNGTAAEGTFHLSRPGRMRLEYDPPVPVLMVATGQAVIHYDKSLKTTTYLSYDSTPAGLLLAERVQLSGGVSVTFIERGPAVMRISLVQTRDPRAGVLTLTFSERPFLLTNWQVTDGQGATTRVMLVEPRTGVSLDPALFRFVEPQREER